MKIGSRQQLIREVADALDMRLDEGCFYLNLTEQEVGLHLPISYGDDIIWPHDGDEVIRIEPLSSHEEFEAMEEFADMQPQPISDKLYRALGNRRPFNHFKETLGNIGLLDKWYAFKNEWYAKKAEEWLHEEEVDFLDGKIVCTGNTLTWIEDEDC